MATVTTDPLVGRLVDGRYEVVSRIARGGMATVYLAIDRRLEREVALKVLPDYLAGDESFETRFRRESRLAARLNEPHIIPIHDFGEIDGRLFLDMRLVEGRDLGSVLETRGRLPLAMAVDIVSQAASALVAPITMLEAEHAEAGAALERMRAITGGYAPPEWACPTFRGLYYGLSQLEADLQLHVHLENNVLFPRAVWMASRART